MALTLLTAAYPLLVYVGIAHLQPRWLAVLLATLAIVRAIATRERVWLAAAGGAMVLALVAALGNQLLPLKLYPALVNCVLLLLFTVSLRYPPTVIERLARLRDPELPQKAVVYTRRVTAIWCIFFALNGAMALYTALRGSDAAWALYNGCVSYLLMGCLFAGEWLLRRRLTAGTSHA